MGLNSAKQLIHKQYYRARLLLHRPDRPKLSVLQSAGAHQSGVAVSKHGGTVLVKTVRQRWNPPVFFNWMNPQCNETPTTASSCCSLLIPKGPYFASGIYLLLAKYGQTFQYSNFIEFSCWHLASFQLVHLRSLSKRAPTYLASIKTATPISTSK